MMSSVMAYFLFWMMFIHKQECGVRLDHHNRNALEYVIQKYMNPLRRLSADLPNHAIEMEIEIHGSAPKEVKNNPRRFIRLINPHYPKPIPRAQDDQDGEEVKTDVAANAVAPDAEKATAAPAVVPVAPTGTDPDTAQKIPVFMEDLKKALDELEKKLMTTPDNVAVSNGNAPNGGAPGAPAVAPQPLSPQTRSIDDIVQLLKKAIHVENRMPKVGDDKLEWVQIKIPKSVQL